MGRRGIVKRLALPTFFLTLLLAALTAVQGYAEIQFPQVVRVVDGDTIIVDIDGKEEEVSLIGIDAPETKHPSKPVERCGKEATEFVAALLDGESEFWDKPDDKSLLSTAEIVVKGILPETDEQERDEDGRLLAYVYVLWAPHFGSKGEDRMLMGANAGNVVHKLFLNAELVKAGLATVLTTPPNVKHNDEFLKLQEEAQKAKRGIWGEDACEPVSDGEPKEKEIEIAVTWCGYVTPISETDAPWYGLFGADTGFEFKEAKITIEMDDEDLGCIKINHTDEPVFLIRGYDNLEKKKIKTVFSGYTKMDIERKNMNEEVVFKLSDKRYGLIATGSEKESREFKIVENYKLELSEQKETGDTTQTLFTFPRLDMMDGMICSPSIRWAGDIDSDGKLDLLLDLGKTCYDSTFVLFLSSFADKGDLVKKVAEYMIDTDC